MHLAEKDNYGPAC